MKSKKVSALFGCILFLLCLCVSDYAQSETENQAHLLEKEKLFEEAGKIAEKFISRWHETLDINALKEEFYVKDIKVWQSILGNGLHGWDFENIKVCNQKSFEQNTFALIQQAAFSIATFVSLLEEYEVYYYGTSTEPRVYPDHIADIGLRIQNLLDAENSELEKLVDKSLAGPEVRDCDAQLQRFLTNLTSEVDASSTLFRQQLPSSLFQDEQYTRHLKELIAAEILEEPPDLTKDTDLSDLLRFHNSEAPLLVQDQFESKQVKRQLIEVRKGIFSLVFIQEGGQLRLLFAMPTRIAD